MRILYISSVCAQRRFDRLAELGFINSQFQNQKFHNLLLRGLNETGDVSITVVSFYPINRIKGLKLKHEEEIENGIHYVYPRYTNLPILHHVAKFSGTYRFLMKQKCKSSDSVIVCNIMNFDECLAALLFRFFHCIKVCAITADVPGITSGSERRAGAWWKRKMTEMVYPFYKSMSCRYDAYMFLAQAMNDVVNHKNKPYIVVEGLADLSMKGIDITAVDKYPQKTVMYAGGLHKEYGISLLVDAFRMINEDNVELHIYGKGNYEEELKRISIGDHRIKYFGTKPNSEVVTAQMRAHVLVNPRPTGLDFVKYSFPSKIMECMASGTPLLTTHIPSMPDEYLPFVYLVEDETVYGLNQALNRVLSLPELDLATKGQDAKSFILEKKNYRVQARKLRVLINSII